jgi:hypothetical protein
MTDTTSGAGATAKRGRKPETPAERIARLQQELQAAKHAAKEAEQRQCAVVGAALLAEAEGNAALKAQIVEILRRRVTAAAAKADIAGLLV